MPKTQYQHDLFILYIIKRASDNTQTPPIPILPVRLVHVPLSLLFFLFLSLHFCTCRLFRSSTFRAFSSLPISSFFERVRLLSDKVTHQTFHADMEPVYPIPRQRQDRVQSQRCFSSLSLDRKPKQKGKRKLLHIFFAYSCTEPRLDDTLEALYIYA